jgi:hypothetical protein
MRKILTLTRVVAVCSLGVIAVACGSDDGAADIDEAAASADTLESAATTSPADTAPTATASADVELPMIVVTTNILGDIVTQTVGDLAEVEVIMPTGADPHDFAPSARQAESMENADLLVVNGAGFEEGMLSVIEQVESSGTPVFTFADQIDLIEFDGDDDHSDDDRTRSIRTRSIRTRSIRTRSIRTRSIRTRSIRTRSIRTRSIRTRSIRTRSIRTTITRTRKTTTITTIPATTPTSGLIRLA